MADNSYTDIMEKNHMEIPWHDYARQDGNILIDKAGLIEKASVIGRVGLIMLSCGTGAWRVRTSMNRLSKELGVTCTVDVGLMSIEFNCFDAHRRAAGIDITEKTVTNIMPAGNGFMVLADNEMYEARTLILCMGVMSAKQLDREDELLGKRLSYCATCDGMFYKDKRIAVICNDKKYEHEVKYLADLATEVLYFPAYNDSEIELPNVKISKDVPIALIGDSFVEGITLRSGKTESVDGVFCLRNAIAPSKLMPQLEIENGHILVDRAQQTNVAGCFAAGDCTGRPYQYTKAVGEGNVAAHSCIQYLSKSEK